MRPGQAEQRLTLISAFIRIASRQVEVGPSSFQKVKLLGKGDVGKVYLVCEKKTDKLFAMKGASAATELFGAGRGCEVKLTILLFVALFSLSAFKEGDDQKEQDQAGVG